MSQSYIDCHRHHLCNVEGVAKDDSVAKIYAKRFDENGENLKLSSDFGAECQVTKKYSNLQAKCLKRNKF